MNIFLRNKSYKLLLLVGESVSIISKGDHHGQILQQYGVQYQCEKENNGRVLESSSVDFDPSFSNCSLHDVSGSSNRVQAICSVGGTKKVHILQKSQMFVTNSSSGKGEEKNKSLLANGPLTIEGRNIYQYSRVLF